MGLAFQLAADVLATAIAPTWEAVRLLAAIVVTRTVLNYFRSKELEREQASPRARRLGRLEAVMDSTRAW